MAEEYHGVKFSYQATGSCFQFDNRLADLNSWAWIFSQLGLTPVHSAGAFGNHSFRATELSFIITKTGMIPSEECTEENFCAIDQFDAARNHFTGRGYHVPSSESYLHYCLYRSRPEIAAILHGHCELLNRLAPQMGIPTTACFEPYGSPALAHSAVVIAQENTDFFILKEHGFVSIGRTIGEAGQHTLKVYTALLNTLQRCAPNTSNPSKNIG